MSTTVGGFKDKKLESRTKVEPTTVQYIGENRQGLDAVAQVAYLIVGTDAVESGSTANTIVATAHAARVGDQIRFSSGAQNGKIAIVQSVTTNTIVLSQLLSAAPAAADTFAILRPNFIASDANGASSVSGTVTANQGTDPWTVQGPGPQFSAIGTKGVFPTAFQDLFGNLVVPTGLNASGVIVMGVMPLDATLNLQSFRNTGECFALTAATANTTATSRFMLVNSSGHLAVDLTKQITVQFAQINATVVGDNTIVAADATRKIKVLSYSYVCAASPKVAWKSGAGTNLTPQFVPNNGVHYVMGPGTAAGGHLMETAVNQALVINLTAGSVLGHLSYYLEA